MESLAEGYFKASEVLVSEIWRSQALRVQWPIHSRLVTALSAGPSIYTTMRKHDESCGIHGHRNSEQGMEFHALLAPIYDPCHSIMQRLDSHPCKRRTMCVAVPDLAEGRDNVDSVYGASRDHLSKAASQWHDSEMHTCNFVYLFYQLPLQGVGGQAGGSVLGGILDSRMRKTWHGSQGPWLLLCPMSFARACHGCVPLGLFIPPRCSSLLEDSHLRNEALWTCKINGPLFCSWLKCLFTKKYR